MWQCLRKYHDSEYKARLNLVNAGKYLSDILAIIAGGFYVAGIWDFKMWTFFILHMISSTYSYSWDIYMDWGLLRCWDKGKYGLRDKINYPAVFYY